MANVQGSWSISGTTASFSINGTVVAKVTGLPTGTTVDDGAIDGITVKTDSETGLGTITFNSEALLNSTKISLTSSTKNYTYSLALNQHVTQTSFNNVTETLSKGTYTLTGDVVAGYQLSADGKTITYYANKTNQKLATVTGLNTALTTESGAVTYSEGTVTVKETALADKTFKMTFSNGGKFDFVVDEYPQVKVVDGDITTQVKSGTATFTAALTKGYTKSADGLTYTYTAAKPATTVLAKFNGLATTATASDIELELDSNDESGFTGTITVTNKEAIKSANSTLTLSNGGAYTLALDDSADWSAETGLGYWLVSGNKATYKQDVTEGWTLNGKSVVYTKAVTNTLATVSGLLKGFAADGIYEWDETKEKFLLTKNAKGVELTEGSGEVLEGIEISTEGTTNKSGTITLDKRALGTSKVTVGAKENFTLAIDTTGENKVDGKLSADTNCWVVSGTTATYKKALPAYYAAASDGKSVTYTATSKGETPLATVKGLAKDLFVGTSTVDGNKITEVYKKVTDETSGDVSTVVVMTVDDAKKEITLYDGAQGTSNISVGAKESYILKLNKTEANGGVISAPAINEDSNITWKVNNGTATLNGVLKAGFMESADGKTLIYTKGSTQNRDGSYKPLDIVSIKGLDKTKIANQTLTSSSLDGLADAGITISDYDEDGAADTGLMKVTLSAGVLGAGNVTVSNANYKLALDEDGEGDDDVPQEAETLKVWRISGTTATYKTVSTAYYTYDEDKNTIVYHAEKDVSVHAVVTGLATSYKDESGTTHKIAYSVDSEGNLQYSDNEEDKGNVFADIEGNSKAIKFTATEVLGNKVALDSKKTESGYTLGFDEDVKYAPEIEDTPTWEYKANTSVATLKGNMSAGFSISSDNATITKVNAVSNGSAKLATITGIKNSGLAVESTDKTTIIYTYTDEDGEEQTTNAITYNNTEKVITLNNAALNQAEVSIDSAAGYTLAIDGEVATPESGKTGWTLDTSVQTMNSATLKQGTSAGYEVANGGKSITYSESNYTKSLATVQGLSKNIEVDENGQIDGIRVEGTTIYLQKKVLGDSTIYVGSSGYKLVMEKEDETTVTEFAQENSTAWDLAGSTAVLIEYTTKGWKQKGTQQITYNKDSYGSTIATISGLKDGLELVDGQIGSYDKSGKFTPALEIDTDEDGAVATSTYNDGENEISYAVIRLNDSALDKKKDVTLINNSKATGTDYTYKLALEPVDGNKERSIDTPAWTVKNGTATYKLDTSAGYAVTGGIEHDYNYTDDNGDTQTKTEVVGETITYKSKASSTTTISGLNIDNTSTASAEPPGGIELNEEDGTITLAESVRSTDEKKPPTIKGNYTFAKLDDDEAPDVSGVTWTYYTKKGTVTMVGDVGEGWTVSSDGKTLLHTSKQESASSLAVISGLAKNLTQVEDTSEIDNPSENTIYFKDGNDIVPGVVFDPAHNTITINKAAATNANVTINSKTYPLAIGDLTQLVDGSAPEPADVWRISGTTATYKRVNPAYYTYDEAKNTIVYHKETDVKDKTYAVVTGLDKDKLAAAYKDGEISGLIIDSANSKITVSNSVLGNSEVKLTKGSYKFELAGDVPSTAEDVDEWQLSGNTATYKHYQKAYYAYDSTKNVIKCTKSTNGTNNAVVSGINTSGKTADDFADECYTEVTGGTNVITLNEDWLTTKNVTLKGTGYALALDDTTVTAPEKTNTEFTKKSNTVAELKGDISAGWTKTSDNLITYTAAKEGTVLATVSGINLTDGDAIEDLGLDESNSTITLSDTVDAEGNYTGILKGVKKNVTLGKNDLYTFEVNKYEVVPPEEGDDTFVVKGNGTVTYQSTTPAGFTLSSDAKTLVYSAEVNNVKATITGLAKDTKTFKLDLATSDLEEVPTAISIWTRETEDGEWKETTANAIVIDPAELNKDGTVKTAGTVKINSRDVFASATGKLSLGKGDNYTFVAGDGVAPEDFSEAKWYISGTTATLKDGQTDGFTPSADGRTLTYSKEETEDSELAKITGLAKGLKAGTGDYAGQIGTTTKVSGVETFTSALRVVNFGDDGKKISLNDNAFGTTNISLTSDSGNYIFDAKTITQPTDGGMHWYIKNGTATLKQKTTAGFALDDETNPTVLTYTAGNKDTLQGDALLTVSGLAKEDYDGMSASDSLNPISIDTMTNVVTVRNEALNASKVTVKSNDKTKEYTLEMASDVIQKDTTGRTGVTEWVTPTNGTTATYKTYDKGYYEYGTKTVNKEKVTDETTLNYVKETTGTSYATISGLKKNAEISSANFNAQTKVITITEDMLDGSGILDQETNKVTGKTLTLKGDAYTFDASELDSTAVSLGSNELEWTVASNGTATYKGTIGGGYQLSADKKSFTYNAKDKANQTVITITGLNSDADLDLNENTGVITVDDNDLKFEEINEDTGKVTLKGGTVKLTKGDGYKLNYAGEASSIRGDTATTWNIKSGTGTYSGAVTEGYKLAADGKSIVYTAASTYDSKTETYKTSALVTIKGMNKEITSAGTLITTNDTSKTVSLSSGALTDKVTVTGGDFAINFNSDYSNSSITGSANSDVFVVKGTGNTINTAAGNDYVTFDGHNNTFFYASGNGDDVIANFNSTDKLNINAAITAENIKIGDVDGNGKDDAIVALGKGSITLTDYAKSDITIIDKTKTATTYGWSDTLGYIVKSNANAYVMGDAEITQTPELLKTDSIAYSGSDKK